MTPQQQQPSQEQLQVQHFFGSEDAVSSEIDSAGDEFWTIASTRAASNDSASMCAICLAALHHSESCVLATTPEGQPPNVVQLHCSHSFHKSCIARCIDQLGGSLCCPLCRTVFYTAARRHVMEATAEAEAAAAAIAESGDRHRQRLQQRLEARRARRAAGRG